MAQGCACITAQGLVPSCWADPQLRRQETWVGWTCAGSGGAGGSQQHGLHWVIDTTKMGTRAAKMAAAATPQHLRSKLTLPTLALPHPIGWGTSSTAPDWLCLWSVSHTGEAGMGDGMGCAGAHG